MRKGTTMNYFCRVVLLVVAVTVCSCQPSQSEKTPNDKPKKPEGTLVMKVMTFNVLDAQYAGGWVDKQGTGRGAKAVETIKSLDPDIIGLQEDIKTQNTSIVEDFGGEYEVFGVGGLDGKEKGRYNSILYRKADFELLDGGTIWLSLRPYKVGSSPQKNGSPRTATWIKLRNKRTGLKFFLLNAHWDNGYHGNRKISSMLVRERLTQLAADMPVIVTGDLNCKEDSEELQNLLGVNDPTGRQLIDAYRVLNPEKKPDEEGTCENNPRSPRIDFILHTSDFQPTGVIICREKFLGGWASDHFPVMATLKADAK